MHGWPDSGILCILMHSDRLQLPCNDMKLGELKVNGMGDQGGYMRDPQAFFLWTACFHAITRHLLCGRMLRGLFEPPGSLPGPNTQPQALPHH